MANVHIVVDSTAHLRQELLQNHANLHVVPLTVRLGEREWTEPELGNAELFHLVAELSLFPRTAQPAPGAFLEIFTPLLAAGNEIIVLTISSGLSGTAGSARSAAEMAGSKGVYIVDSGTTAVGMEKLAEAALEMAARDMSAVDIARQLTKLAGVTRTMFIPGTLEYLHKGGRIGGAAALFGSLLQIKPILFLTDGKVTVLDKVRTRQRAIERMMQELTAYGPPVYIGVVNVEAESEAEQLAARLQELYPNASVSVSGTGSVLGAHLGPRILGIVFQNELPR